MHDNLSYRAKQSNLSGLNGISDRTLEMHYKLFEGYVKESTRLLEKLSHYSKDGRVDPGEMEGYSELTRRLGFEYNATVLHEYYFGNLKKIGSDDPPRNSPFYQAAELSFGRYETWKSDFMNKGKMRGEGWVVCSQDPSNGRLMNHWITLHEIGNVAGFRPLVVIDVWEHAFLLDYQSAERGKYIDAFMSNIDWDAVEGRLQTNAVARSEFTF